MIWRLARFPQVYQPATSPNHERSDPTQHSSGSSRNALYPSSKAHHPASTGIGSGNHRE